MISFTEALQIVTSRAQLTAVEHTPLDKSLHRVLAAAVFSDTDMPPFDKSAMDGYACRREDLQQVLRLIETIPAGTVPAKKIEQGLCSKIMTGSMLPAGADCVIMVEYSEVVDNQHIRFTASDTSHNICYKAEDIKKGQLVLHKGLLIGPQHIAVLAASGETSPLVYKQLTTGILTSGDELVEPGTVPALPFIRNTNAWQLKAQAEKMGLITSYYGIVRDDEDELTARISRAKDENDLILLTGGVSKGDFDLVPGVLEKLGFQVLFREIAVQPGKPTLFAVSGTKCCFGLPGNPVSSFVQFENLVKPFAWKSMGYNYQPEIIHLPLEKTYQRKKAERLAFIPVIIVKGKVKLLDYHGSAHIHAYTEADGMMFIEPGKFHIEEGELVDVRLI